MYNYKYQNRVNQWYRPIFPGLIIVYSFALYIKLDRESYWRASVRDGHAAETVLWN